MQNLNRHISNGNIEFYSNGLLDGTFPDKYPDRPMYLEAVFYDVNKKVENLYIYKEVLKTHDTIQTTEMVAKVDGYRYGFQGQERDDEIKGRGNSYNYTFRMHDSRLGRFFAVDPLAIQYPHNSPYAFSENVVINAVELEGLEKLEISNPDGTTSINNAYSIAFNLNTSNGAVVPVYRSGNNFAITGAGRSILEQDPNYTISNEVGKWDPTFVRRGTRANTLVVGFGGLSGMEQTEGTRKGTFVGSDYYFPQIKITVASNIQQTVTTTNMVPVPNRVNVNGRGIFINGNSMPLLNAANGDQLNAVNNYFDNITSTIRTLTDNPNNAAFNMNIPFNNNMSTGAMSQMTTRIDGLRTLFPSVNFTTTGFDTIPNSNTIIFSSSINFTTTTPTVTTSTDTVPSLTGSP